MGTAGARARRSRHRTCEAPDSARYLHRLEDAARARCGSGGVGEDVGGGAAPFKTSSAAAPACERQRTHFRSARFCSARLSPQEGRAAAPEHTNSGGSPPRISNVDQETVRPRVWMGRGGWDTTGRPLSPGGREAPWTIILRLAKPP